MFQEGIRKKMWTIPTIEEIYNEYHKQKFFQRNGIYPKTIKNFDSLLNDSKKKEFLLRFQNMIKSNQQQAPRPKEQGENNVITSLRKFIAYKHKNQNMEKDDF